MVFSGAHDKRRRVMLVARDYLQNVSKDDELFTSLMNDLIGGVSLKEGWALRRYAASTNNGCIVEIGTFRGKSAVALSVGVAENSANPLPMIYCIEPHQAYTGFYGGQFGPIDRGHFYKVMATTGAYNYAALVNLPSAVAANCWRESIGLLFIDGSHYYEEVKNDFSVWSPHVCDRGYIAFDDAQDVNCGPWRVVNEAVESGQYVVVERVGKIVFLQKQIQSKLFSEGASRKILVACEHIVNAGGLWRFDRIAVSLRKQGHKLYFLPLDPKGPDRPTDVPVLQIDEAHKLQWDATMIPGAGFSEKTIEKFSMFKSPQFGVRIQHILNDQTRKCAFLSVNNSFAPHVVIFNNHSWPVGSYTEFQAQRFHTLIGAVDVDQFKPSGQKKSPLKDNTFVVGGLANKNPKPLLEALKLLPTEVSLKLFGNAPAELSSTYSEMLESGRLELVGPLRPPQLVEFYQDVDAIVHTELFAGWANLVAESMASGVPVICTKHGTSALAQDKVSALVLETVSPEAIAQFVNLLRHDKVLSQSLVKEGLAIAHKFTWDKYTEQLLELCKKPSFTHYFNANELSLYGKWPKSWRLEELDKLIEISRSKTILEVGSAEGVISCEFLNAGAKLLHGFEIDPSRVEFSTELCKSQASVFRVADCSNWDSFYAGNRDLLLPCYDIVLFLGIFHHLPGKVAEMSAESPVPPRKRFLENILQLCNDYFAIRTPFLEMSEASEVINAHGFVLDHCPAKTDKVGLGSLCIYKRKSNPIHFVSYPKSGRSWIRYVMTVLGVADCFYFHHDQFEFNDGSLPNHDFSVSDRLVKYPRFSKIVLMRRNPFDVIVSLYHQVTGRFKDFFHYEGTISAFIRDPYFGAIVLRDFIKMWDAIKKERNVHVVSYEDMHARPVNVITSLLAFAGINKLENEIIDAVKSSSFENMKRVESDGKFDHPWLRPRNECPKVRKGVIGGYKEELSATDVEYLNAVFR